MLLRIYVTLYFARVFALRAYDLLPWKGPTERNLKSEYYNRKEQIFFYAVHYAPYRHFIQLFSNSFPSRIPKHFFYLYVSMLQILHVYRLKSQYAIVYCFLSSVRCPYQYLLFHAVPYLCLHFINFLRYYTCIYIWFCACFLHISNIYLSRYHSVISHCLIHGYVHTLIIYAFLCSFTY